MKAFITTVLGYSSQDPEIGSLGGILGKVEAYYGCVEAQGRGSLHCHMLVWINGAMNPDEIRSEVMRDPEGKFVQDLLKMLDDTISNDIPYRDEVSEEERRKGPHPCAIRGPIQSCNESRLSPELERKVDICRLVTQCQVHAHTRTCYKYWKGPPDPKECRFDLDDKNVKPISTVDPETGELKLRCLNGLVNNFNETIIEAVRCNMDIKFIGSGQSAKAVLNYITDYITKSQLKTHVAYAALEMAVNKLGEFNEMDNDKTVRAKRLLQKCAYAMLSHQELSGQQVASYLLGYGDHYTSHSYQPLWWRAFEAAFNKLDPKQAGVGVSEEPDEAPESQIPEGEGNASTDNDDEVVIGIEDDTLVPRAGQTADYLFRGEEFRNLCVWDFVSYIEKVAKRRRRKKTHPDASPEPSGEDVTMGPNDEVPPEISEVYSVDTLLTRGKNSSLSAALLHRHLQSTTHLLRTRAMTSALIPVPMGPALPRQDRPELYEKYCRLMLILFKPWRTPKELRSPGQTWADAFHDFQRMCPPRHLMIMHNMQLLHECKDSRDDHFAQRRVHTEGRLDGILPAWVDATAEQDDIPGEDTSEEIFLHLQSVEQSKSVFTERAEQNAARCVEAARAAGLFVEQGAPIRSPPSGGIQQERFPDSERIDESTRGMEAAWKSAYERNRELQRAKRTEASTSTTAEQPDEHGPRVRYPGTDDGVHEQLTPDLRLNSTAELEENAGFDGLVQQLIWTYTLNEEQSRAFRIICNAAKPDTAQDSLRMYIGGPGGTGKSRVIDAVSEFFKVRNESRRLRLTSYTGVAAHNIGGMTLHSALSLMQGRRRLSTKSQAELMRAWKGVDFLFVDEVSMIGCGLMVDLHQALVTAKDCPRPFGGINIIFAGDFAQLPPVGQTRLYSNSSAHSSARSATIGGQTDMFGRLLWLQVDKVVLLRKSMRQAGSENQAFADLLNRLRLGECEKGDFDLLNSRLASRLAGTPGYNAAEWHEAPIIVADNTCKDHLNEAAAEAFALRVGQPLQWYHSTDTHSGRELMDPRVRSELEKSHSGATAYRLAKVPLIRSMPVVLAQNFDVEGGVVNGTFGTVQLVRYDELEDGTRRARACILRTASNQVESLPGLQQDEIVALEDSVNISFVHPYSGKKCTIKRRQLPLLPAFAITVYKAQGLTLKKVIVDLQSCQGTESAYVSLSRVRSLNDLIILREFDRSRIECKLSEDLRIEFARLEYLNERTNRLQTACPQPSIQEDTETNLAAPSLTKNNVLASLSTYQAELERYYHSKYSMVNGLAGKRRRGG